MLQIVAFCVFTVLLPQVLLVCSLLHISQYEEPAYEEPAYEEPRQNRRQIFDYDAVNREKQPGTYNSYQDVGSDETLNDYPQDNYDNYYNQGAPKSHTGLIVFLVILILLLMAASGFLLFKFLLPNLNPTEPTVQETFAVMTEAPTTVPTTLPTVPCESLALVEGGEVSLSREGQFYLIHATVTPEDTTDTLTYQSEDESIITVDNGGKITAVGEGQTNVVLTCGSQIIRLPVSVRYEDETQSTEAEGETTAEESATEAGSDETVAEGETQEAKGEAQETTAPETAEEGLKTVDLKLKKSDIMFGRQGVSFTLELDCDLDPKEVEWTSTDMRVATVKDGVITTVGPGVCQIVAKYGAQEARCIIRCSF